ncbi:hypothetical protein [Paenibacillus harenae]|uniref:hypothetical protein n=1 Tax=Paenibacillus harenae TaxID=306543 RepID=UPI0027947E63|nr:hypothetical protein [Paenibacillus harenae]MDQ0062388.1 hypothetical protein [Paenibacillus harenae]
MKNLTSDNYPAFSTRSGFSLLGSAFANPILGLASWKNSELHTVSNGNWHRFVSGSWGAALKTGLSTAAEWSFTNFKGNLTEINLIGSNGIDAVQRYNGTTVQTLTGAPSSANYITTYSNRLFAAVGNTVHASELNVPTNWTTTIGSDADPFQIIVSSTDGETINALRPGIGHLTIFKPNSMYELFGEDISNVRIEPIDLEVGAINNKCVVTLNGIVFMIHRTGIYRYGGGTRPSRDFSQPVQAYIDQMNTAARSKCCIGTDGEKVYCSIPVTSSTAPDTVLVYDPKYDMWTVWEDFSALHMAQSSFNAYMGFNDGRVVQLGGTTDNGTPISFERVSKPFGSASLNKLIRWFKLWIMCDVPSGSTLNIYLSPSATGDSDWTLVGYIDPATNYQSKRIILTPTQIANSNYVRIKFSGSGPVTVYELDRDQREFPLI